MTLSPADVFALIASLEFETLSGESLRDFPGVENETALLSSTDNYTVIIDGNIVQITDSEGYFESYTLSLV